MSDLLTVAQVAKRLKVTGTRVRVLIRSGRLKATRVGSFYVVKVSDLSTITPGKPGRPRNKP